MNVVEAVHAFWKAAIRKDADKQRTFFTTDAVICWPNSNERFTVEEYLRANCEYPGEWRGIVERVEHMGDKAVSVTRAWMAEGPKSFHAVSFFQFKDGKINRLDEYWGDDGPAPHWRQVLGLGEPIE